MFNDMDGIEDFIFQARIEENNEIEPLHQASELYWQPHVIQNIESGQLVQMQPLPDLNQNQAAQQIECIDPQLIHFNQRAHVNEVFNTLPVNSEQNANAQQYQNPAAPINQQLATPMDLFITEEPQSTIRFRTITDPNTHGVIQGATSSSSSSQCFPTVQLKVYDNEKQNLEYYVVVDCYIKSTEERAILSPHLFGHKLPRNNRRNANAPKYEVISGPVIEKISPQSTGDFKYSFKNYFIISQSSEAVNAVQEKYANLEALGLIQDAHEMINYVQSKTDIIPLSNNAICLGFSIYEKTPNGYKYGMGPKLSTAIYHANKSVQLTRVCNERGRVEGGDEITLLVTGITEKNTAVIIKEIEGKWSTKIQPNDSKVHQKSAITFTLPPYEGQNPKNMLDIYCHIYLEREDGVQSETRRFVYESDRKRKRKISSEAPNQTASATISNQTCKKLLKFSNDKEFYTDSACILSPNTNKALNISNERIKVVDYSEKVEIDIKELNELLSKTQLDNKENICRKFEYENNFGSTLFHDAIEHDKFLTLYKIIKKYRLEEFMDEFRNSSGDTILHHACRLGKRKLIRALIGMNLKLCSQNEERQTPLHVAIESGDNDTIDELTKLIEDPNEYKYLNEEFKRSLGVYDKSGLTVLHRAIINDRRELAMAIVQFYLNESIDLYKYEVLGNGDSILHLAASKGLKEMAKRIVIAEPEALYYENYRGEKALEVCAKLFKKLCI